jgi:hypothetical protein
MITLQMIADLSEAVTDDSNSVFDDSKDIFLRTLCDECIAVLKIDDSRSMILWFLSEKDFVAGDFHYLAEIKNNKNHGCIIAGIEHIEYREFKNGILDGYTESHYQGGNLEYRGIYSHGVRDGYWEWDYNYDGYCEWGKDYGYKFLGPWDVEHYSGGTKLGNFALLETQDDYREAAKDENKIDSDLQEKEIRKIIQNNRIYRGKYNNYVSRAKFQEISNLAPLQLKSSKYPSIYHPVSNYVSDISKRHDRILKNRNLDIDKLSKEIYNIEQGWEYARKGP